MSPRPANKPKKTSTAKKAQPQPASTRLGRDPLMSNQVEPTPTPEPTPEPEHNELVRPEPTPEVLPPKTEGEAVKEKVVQATQSVLNIFEGPVNQVQHEREHTPTPEQKTEGEEKKPEATEDKAEGEGAEGEKKEKKKRAPRNKEERAEFYQEQATRVIKTADAIFIFILWLFLRDCGTGDEVDEFLENKVKFKDIDVELLSEPLGEIMDREEQEFSADDRMGMMLAMVMLPKLKNVKIFWDRTEKERAKRKKERDEDKARAEQEEFARQTAQANGVAYVPPKPKPKQADPNISDAEIVPEGIA